MVEFLWKKCTHNIKFFPLPQHLATKFAQFTHEITVFHVRRIVLGAVVCEFQAKGPVLFVSRTIYFELWELFAYRSLLLPFLRKSCVIKVSF